MVATTNELGLIRRRAGWHDNEVHCSREKSWDVRTQGLPTAMHNGKMTRRVTYAKQTYKLASYHLSVHRIAHNTTGCATALVREVMSGAAHLQLARSPWPASLAAPHPSAHSVDSESS